MAAAAALAVLGGFAPTYYLKALYGTPALSPLLHIHGMVFSLWFVLFFTQTALIAARRTDIHRRLGVAGALLAIVMIVLGVTVAIAAAKRPTLNLPPGFPPPLVFLAVPLGDLFSFTVLVTAGLYHRRNRDAHKRLMLLGTIAILNAALARLLIPGGMLAFLGLPVNPLTFLALSALFVIPCLLYDRLARGRIHPALLWGGPFILVAQLARLALSGTSAWLAVARWLTS